MEEIVEQMFMMQVLQEVMEMLGQIINLRQEKPTPILIQLNLQEATVSLTDQVHELIPSQVEVLLQQEVVTADLQEIVVLAQVDLLLQEVAQLEVVAAKVVPLHDQVDQEGQDNL